MYSLVFSEEVLEELGMIELPEERRKVMAAIRCLTVSPESGGVAEAVDQQGRVNRIGVIGTVGFVYWADHAFRKLRILSIRSVAD